MKDALFTQTSGIILSAGSSTRMRTHKALLKFDSEKTFLQKITETYLLSGIEQLVVVVNFELFQLIRQKNYTLPEKVKFIINEKPELGRFFSLQTGLKNVTVGNSCFFQNIDNPFVTKETIDLMLSCSGEAEIVKPCNGEKCGHPVLVGPAIIRAIIAETDYSNHIDAFLHGYSLFKVEVQDTRILANINQPDDYNKAGFNV